MVYSLAGRVLGFQSWHDSAHQWVLFSELSEIHGTLHQILLSLTLVLRYLDHLEWYSKTLGFQCLGSQIDWIRIHEPEWESDFKGHLWWFWHWWSSNHTQQHFLKWCDTSEDRHLSTEYSCPQAFTGPGRCSKAVEILSVTGSWFLTKKYWLLVKCRGQGDRGNNIFYIN